MRPALALCIILAAVVPATAAEIIDTQATDGTCERLSIADEDLTAECGTVLAILTYDDGRVAISAGTGGQAFFGLGEPERMLLLFGPGKPWTDFQISSVVISAATETEDPAMADASGACTHTTPRPAFSSPARPKTAMAVLTRSPIARTADRSSASSYFNIHSCSGALWNFHTRFGPAMTLR